MKLPLKRILVFLTVFGVFCFALWLRLSAVQKLPIDYDEDDYLGAGQVYARAIKAGDWNEVINYDYNYEHPPLTKIVYGLVIMGLPEAPQLREGKPTEPPVKNLPRPHFIYARNSSAVFGSLESLALAVINPLAGLLLAVNTWQIKYTSQIMLEPLPALASLLAVLFYMRSRQKFNFWTVLSAVMLGITAASKYPYALVGLAILMHWLWTRRPDNWRDRRSLGGWLLPVLAWGLIALAFFVALDPRLWTDPVNRLKESLFFHGGYSQSKTVKDANYPPWQQLVWLAQSVPWHPGVFPITIDSFIFVFAILGLPRLWKKQPVMCLWLGLMMAFLFVWPTKWPQYLLMMLAPFSLSAAEGFQEVVSDPMIRTVRDWMGKRKPARPDRAAQMRVMRKDSLKALPWILPGLLALSVIAIYPLIFQGAMSLTDFNSTSIRDGLQGGVWREAIGGITGQEKAIKAELFSQTRSKDVHYLGLAIYEGLFSGGAADIVVFNIIWMILSVLLQVMTGVGIALILHQRGLRFRSAWRALFILPWAIPEFVGALIWLRLLEPKYGWLALAQNLPKDVNVPAWFSDPGATLVTLLIAATWYGFPFVVLAAGAGLKQISDEVYDAAAIDGAGAWARFWHVTWPMLLPLLAPAMIIRMIFAFNQFYLFNTLQIQPPMTTFANLSYLIFNPSGYFGGQFGLSAAINMFTVLVLICLILWFNRWSKAAEGVTYA
ncbi:MAG TPA: ABC transporter permease subunit [Anaerolineaceae bacterium]|nr:ABC transporter permease subunit [Anaerolineaceae bacterium]HPN50642.1 ABC transporter permease subunit [Anaerolineaceae bacterium]